MVRYGRFLMRLSEIYHEKLRCNRSMWMDRANQCWEIYDVLQKHWNEIHASVPYNVLKYESIHKNAFRKLKSPKRTFDNTLKLLRDLRIIEREDGGYIPILD